MGRIPPATDMPFPDSDAEASPDTPTTEPDEDADGDGEGGSPAMGDGALELHHIHVGQADATLIVTPERETILIGTWDWPPAGEAAIAYLEAHDIERIDHVVATHGLADPNTAETWLQTFAVYHNTLI